MIRNVIVSLFLLVFVSSIVTLFFRGKVSYSDVDNSGARCILEDFNVLEYTGVNKDRFSRAKLGILKEDGIIELFTMIKSEEFDDKEKIRKKAIADHAVLQLNVNNTLQNFNRKMSIQKIELESNIHILDSTNNFISEKITFEDKKLSSEFPTVVTDGNMSLYSKQGFVYDIDSGVLDINSPVQGEIVRWHY